MKQITEDYCNFEIAKLLKEKGFVGNGDIGCKCGFYSQNINYPNQIDLVYDDLDNSELEHNECLRPTHQLALKWLREVHNLHITIKPYITEDGIMYLFEIYKLEAEKFTLIKTKTGFEKSEFANEAALKYTLENLI